MKTIVHVLFVLFLLSLNAGCDRGEKTDKPAGTVKIGVVAPLTGPYEQWGKSGLLGAETALAAQPVLHNGQKPELIIEDDRNEPEVTRQKLRKLVEEDQVSAVLMFSDSRAVLNAIQDVEKYRTPVLVILSTHPGVTDNNWVTQVTFDDITQGMVAALYVIDELLIDYVAVFRQQNNPHSLSLAGEFVKRFKDAGGRVEQVSLEDDMADLGKDILQLKEKGVKLLYLPLDAVKVVEIESRTRMLGWNPRVMVGDGVLSVIQLQFQNDLTMVEGMLATEIYSNELPETEYARKVIRVFDLLRKKENQRGTVFTGLGCEGASLLLAAMDRCEGVLDRPCINRMLRSTEDFLGLAGKMRVGADGKTERPIFVNSIENQKLKFIVKIY